jgi:hypothetical protein
MSEIKTCPFCGIALRVTNGMLQHFPAKTGGCILDGDCWPIGMLDEWNRRVKEPHTNDVHDVDEFYKEEL